LAPEGAVIGSGRRNSAISSLMPFILVAMSNMLGQSHAAMATLIVVFWADTAIISLPRHATGRK